MSAQTLDTQLPREIASLADLPNVILMAPGPLTRICPNCGGLGTIMAYRVDAGPFPQPAGAGSKWLDIDGRRGWWRGELIAGHCPVCQTGRLDAYLRQISGLEGDELNVSLEGFRTDGRFAGKAQALADARSIMAMNRQPAGMVTLLGEKEVNHGVGKSHLAKGMINGFRQIGITSRYTTLADLLADLHERFGKDQAIRTEDLIDRLQQIRVLAIDEIDKVELAGWDKQTFFRLIDYRQRRAGELLTILIANAYEENGSLWIFNHDHNGRVKPKAWPAELGYLESRILGGLMITVPGPDYRETQGWVARQEIEEQQEEEEAWYSKI